VLYNRYASKVYQTCLTITKDSVAAQDYTQDIFIKVFSRLDSFQSRSSFSTWLYSISYHYCLDQIRINKRLQLEPLADDLIDDELADRIPDSNSAELLERQMQVREAVLRTLPEEELTLLQLKYEQGLTVQAISERYGLSVSAVKMRLKRTRDKLQNTHLKLRY
jgi:RNA polymerase sigma-70 factor (ECF subfamily)